MATQSTDGRPDGAVPERAQPPIRWPRPSGVSLGLVALWAVGGVIALFVPMSIVPPSVRTAPAADVWTAFATTMAGAIIMITASVVLWRRMQDAAVLIMGAIPGFACIVGAIIFTAAKLTGT